jgi:Protein of unknown function (DUF2933)
MSDIHSSSNEGPHAGSRGSHLLLMVFLVAAAFFLWTEHRAHVLGVLPYLVFLACPLIHLFSHRGHGGHGGHHHES